MAAPTDAAQNNGNVSGSEDNGGDSWMWFEIILMGLLLVIVTGLGWIWWKNRKVARVTFDAKDDMDSEMRMVMNEDLNVNPEDHGVILDDDGESDEDDGVGSVKFSAAVGQKRKKRKKVKTPKNNFVALESSDDGDDDIIAMADGDGQTTVR